LLLNTKKNGLKPNDDHVKEIMHHDKILEIVDGIIVMSKFSYNIYSKRMGCKNVEIVPPGCDCIFFNPGNPKVKVENKIFVYVGRVSCLKGLIYTLEAFKKLNRQNCKLWIVGHITKYELGLFKDKFDEIKNIEYKGYMPVDEIYKQCFVMVHPTLTGGFEKVTFEAMAAGVAVITTPIAAHFHIDRKTGFVIPERNTNKLIEKMRYFVDNPESAIKMGAEGRKIALKNGWDRF